MLRQATDADLNQVEEGYQKHFLHEKEHGAFTVFKRGVSDKSGCGESAVKGGIACL